MRCGLFIFIAVLQVISAEIKIEPITEPTLFGKEPFWDVETQTLYYVDVLTTTVYKYVPGTGERKSVKIGGGELVGMFIPRKGSNNKFLTSLGSKIIIVEWDGVSNEVKQIEQIFDEKIEGNGWSDGIEHENGNFWVGSYGQYDYVNNKFAQKHGHLYSINSTRHITKHLDGITVSTGIAWSKDNKKLYHVDSDVYQIHMYDFDVNKNSISNHQILFDVREKNITHVTKADIIRPDGLVTDTDGNLWVSVINAGCILKLHPETGAILQRVDIPTAPWVLSLGFGGVNLDELYVTSGTVFMNDEERAQFPDSGKIMKVTGLGVKGYPPLRSVV